MPTDQEMERFELRAPVAEDMPYLHAFNASEGMDLLDSLDGVMVAADEDGDPIGYVRIMHGADAQAYVNPIVVNPLWRRKGVGKALLQRALHDNGSLRLVSRGPSVPFYESLGFAECDWDSIDRSCAEDCDGCSIRDECRPMPMEIVLS